MFALKYNTNVSDVFVLVIQAKEKRAQKHYTIKT